MKDRRERKAPDRHRRVWLVFLKRREDKTNTEIQREKGGDVHVILEDTK